MTSPDPLSSNENLAGGDLPVPVDHPSPPSPARHAAVRRPIIPAWLRSWSSLRAGAVHYARLCCHTIGFHAVRVPGYLVVLVLRSPRGAWRIIRAAWRWLWDHEGRALRAGTAEQHKTTDEYLRLSQQRDHRVRTRGAVLSLVLLGFALVIVAAVVVAPMWTVWLSAGTAVIIIGMAGVPADKPVITRAIDRPHAPRLTSDVIINALTALGIQGISKNPDAIRFPAPITRDGPSYRADIDLPPGVTAGEIMERRNKLASALSRPLGCVWPEAAPDVHPGRVIIWVGDRDMATAKQPLWPLQGKEKLDMFEAQPVGTDPRGRWASVGLMFTSTVVGAIPRMGKTFWLRLLLLIAGLDPRSELHVFDLKGTGDLSPLAPIAHRYRAGEEDEDIAYALTDLRALREEMRRRAATIRDLPRDLCPENKITSSLAGARHLGLHPIAVGVDECQCWFDHPQYGEEITAIVEDLVRRGPAVGIMLLLATQRPDAKSLPTSIRANAVIRICLKVMGQPENDMVLGTSAYRNGINAAGFAFGDKGIGYVVGAADEPQIIRAVYLDGPAVERIVLRARAVREQEGRLSGYAAGIDATTDPDTEPTDTVLADVLAVIPDTVSAMWSETIVDRLAELRPEAYEAWAELPDGAAKAVHLAAILRPYGVRTVQIWASDPATGAGANRRGVRRTDVAHALAARPARPSDPASG